MPGAAVWTIAARRSATDQVGCACLVSTATPAMCGVAIDVPESTEKPLPLPDAAETVATPGAVTPGLRALSPMRGPADEKVATFSKPELGVLPVLKATALAGAGPPGGPVNVAVSLWSTPKNGIVTGS